MKPEELRERIMKLLLKALNDYNWGGDEDSEGNLRPGSIDLDQIIYDAGVIFEEAGIEQPEEEYREYQRIHR